MKPHEQEWQVDEDGVEIGDYSAVDRYGFVVISAYAREDVGNPDANSEARIRLAAAAPDMARALMAFISEDGHTPDCGSTLLHERSCSTECAAARVALRKAGVLP